MRNNVLSSEYGLEKGPPQGRILSPILFILIINMMFRNTPEIAKALFFDDGLAWATGDTLDDAMVKMQNALNVINEWGPKWGIKFSTTKTKYMIFTKRDTDLERGTGKPDLSLNFYGTNIERVHEYKYLGLIFDPSLTWTNI